MVIQCLPSEWSNVGLHIARLTEDEEWIVDAMSMNGTPQCRTRLTEDDEWTCSHDVDERDTAVKNETYPGRRMDL